MSRKARYELQSDSSDYHKGYADGMKAAFEESELDAYYAGVGYGKKAAGDKYIGFNNDEERQQFEAGMKNKGKHFRAYRAEPPTFLERLFGIGEARKEHKREKKHNERINKMRKKIRNRGIKRRERNRSRQISQGMLENLKKSTIRENKNTRSIVRKNTKG